jgi:hypothetical protein
VLPGGNAGAVTTRARDYMRAGQLPRADGAGVAVTPVNMDLGGGLNIAASQVTVSYPFEFIVLQPVARLVVRGSTMGAPFAMTATAVMRNE